MGESKDTHLDIKDNKVLTIRLKLYTSKLVQGLLFFPNSKSDYVMVI